MKRKSENFQIKNKKNRSSGNKGRGHYTSDENRYVETFPVFPRVYLDILTILCQVQNLMEDDV